MIRGIFRIMKKRLFRYTILVIVLLLFVSLLSSCVKTTTKRAFEPDYDSYNTYAFFGVDSRSDESEWKEGTDTTGTEGAPSSDVIMLIRIDEDTEDVSVTSVYRDTLLDILGEGELDKCNAAYRNGDAYGAIDMLERNLDVKIAGYATADFIAVAEAIDALGGITVDVEEETLADAYKDKGDTSIDIINNLIDELNQVYHKDSPHLTSGGKQELDGIQAVAYSRLRYTSGSDMRRTTRQRDILTLMVAKLKDADDKTQRKVLKEMYPTIDSDMSEGDLMDLFDTLMNFDLGDMQGFPYYKRAKKINKEWYVVPCDLVTNVTELHRRIYGEDEYEPSDDIYDINDQIFEMSGLTDEDADETLTDQY